MHYLTVCHIKKAYGPIAGIYMGTRPMVIVSDFDLIKDLYKKYEASGRPIQKPFHEARFGSADGTQRGLLQSTGHNGFKAFMKEH